MAIEGVPWMVAGGLHSAEVGRSLAFAATRGATGVTLPGDFKVTALPTPGGAVRIAAGSACIVSRFPNASGQSYIARGVGSTDVSVPQAGTSTTTRYVIIRVTDPAYAGQPVPANRVVGPYTIPEVVSSIDNLAFPFIALAKIVMPASATAVTAAMITDLRVQANPQMYLDVKQGKPHEGQVLTTSVGEVFPNFSPAINIPAWAAEASLIATVSSLGSNGNAYGEMSATLGPKGVNQFRTDNAFYDVDTSSDAEQRIDLTMGGRKPIAAALRGTTQNLGTEMRRIDGPGALKTLRGTNVIFQVTFYEGAI